MLYLTIPLGIALVALLALTVIVWRKMPYLRKLAPESHDLGTTIVHDLAPEMVDRVRAVPWRQYLHRTLTATEEFLRRVRQAMFTLGRASDSVIRQVRRAGQQAAREHEEVVAQLEQEKKERTSEPDPDEIDLDDPDQLKAEEQRLIVAIAQSPKDVRLYSDIARVYMRARAYGDAIEALSQAARLAPENDEYLRRLERAKRKQESVTAATPDQS